MVLDGVSETPIALKGEAAQEAFRYLEQHQKTKQRFDKVAQLIQGFESQNGMELLSTVHWVVTQELPNLEPTDEELVRCVHSWNPRKANMKPAHILAAWNRLKQEQWLVCKAPTA